MLVPAIGKRKGVRILLETDIPTGTDNAFAPNQRAWHRMVLSHDNYICQECGEQINPKSKGDGIKALATNKGHHIISQNLIDLSHNLKGLNILLSCGISLCESCHWKEHRRLGNYEYGGAFHIFNKFKGLERLASEAIMENWTPEMNRRYDIFLQVLNKQHPYLETFSPYLVEASESTEYQEKALLMLRSFSNLFYLPVYSGLELLGWNKMSKWTREELQHIVNNANEYFHIDADELAKSYNKSI